MSFFKELGKKILIAAIIGGLTLLAVYYKDNYLEEGSDDLEILETTSIAKDDPIEKKVVTKPNVETVTEPIIQEEIVEIEEPHSKPEPEETIVEKTEEKIIQKPKKKHISEMSFEEYAQSMQSKSTNADDAFSELERETE